MLVHKVHNSAKPRGPLQHSSETLGAHLSVDGSPGPLSVRPPLARLHAAAFSPFSVTRAQWAASVRVGTAGCTRRAALSCRTDGPRYRPTSPVHGDAAAKQRAPWRGEREVCGSGQWLL
mmetsp:Transcript_34361/g.97328  ORF Transcript_34361/g.97328 Transcript_34361/m.97328 type:complete len:119 (-) Transcript_34361:270-626(-)